MMEPKENIIVSKSIEFSLSVIKYCEILERERKFVIANQLLKSGTSIGANIFEAQHAESKSDFIHKMKIAMKEVNETMYWLTLCEHSENYPSITTLREDLDTIFKITSKIIASSKNSLRKDLS